VEAGAARGCRKLGVVMREMKLAELGFTQPLGVKAGPVVLLREVDGERYLAISIGESEAAAIAVAVSGAAMQRPLTHPLIHQVIEALGHRLGQVMISELRDSTFHAELVFNTDIRVSARPSDAIAVALHAGVAIFAADDVLAHAAFSASQISHGPDSSNLEDQPQEAEVQVDQFREFLNQARPEDFDPGSPST
jgi:bifunctional DNase/RNase